jgi:hypothetical protein
MSEIVSPFAGKLDMHMRFEVFMAVKIQVEVFWIVMPCSVVKGYQHFRVIMVLQNVGILPQHYMTSQTRRP